MGGKALDNSGALFTGLLTFGRICPGSNVGQLRAMEPSLLDIVTETVNRTEPKLRNRIGAVIERM